MKGKPILTKLRNLVQAKVKVRHAAVSFLIGTAVVAGLIIINLLAGELDLSLDLTRRSLYTLTEESDRLLKELDQDVILYYLTKPGQENITVRELLGQYDGYRRVRLVTIDPDRNPALIAKYAGDTASSAQSAAGAQDQKTIPLGSVIVVSGDRSRVVSAVDLYNVSYTGEGEVNVYGFKAEQSVTAAVQYAATGKQTVIYQLIGHSEYTFDDFGYSESLGKSNFTLRTHNMTTGADIPEDADIVVILSPSWDFSAVEAERVRKVLDRDGSLLIALDLAQQAMPNLAALLEAWNIRLNRGVIMEQDPGRLIPDYGASPVVFSPLYAEETITAALQENRQNMIMTASLSFSPAPTLKRNIEFIPVLSSSSRAWLRVDLSSSSQSRIASDRSGPHHAAAAAAEKSLETGFQEGARVMAVGSAQIFSPISGLGALKANYDFLVESLSWLAGDEKSINIQSRSLYRLPLQIGAVHAFSYAAAMVIVIPFGIIIAGLIVYLRRKRL